MLINEGHEIVGIKYSVRTIAWSGIVSIIAIHQLELTFKFFAIFSVKETFSCFLKCHS